MQLTAQDVSVVFEGADGAPLPALGPVTFGVDAGAFVALLGPSGCGKSTLVRVFAGLQPPATGTARLDSAPITRPTRAVGMMFQSANLMPWRTVYDNIALPLEIAQVPADEREHAVYDLLPKLGLAGFAHAYPGELSGGMAQRVALGRVLVQHPAVLLLDEPFGALDALTREQISLDLLRVWAQRRQTALMVTHDINEAVLMADRILVMSRRPGRIIADIAVPLARPRDLEMVYGEAFIDTARRVRAAIDTA